MDLSAQDVTAWRKAERVRLLALREALTRDERRRGDALITEFLIKGFPLLGGLVIGIYWPFKGEVESRLALHHFCQQGARGAMPVVVEKATPLRYQEWTPGCATRPGVFGLPVPIDGAVVVPDAVFAPPVGFDARGYRLGYGGGYFDRTLATLSPRPIAIGLAREISRIETIHPQPHDIPMDFIVTEAGIHEVAAAGLRRLEKIEEAAHIAASIWASRRGGVTAARD